MFAADLSFIAANTQAITARKQDFKSLHLTPMAIGLAFDKMHNLRGPNGAFFRKACEGFRQCTNWE
jgi:hypothetical protein